MATKPSPNILTNDITTKANLWTVASKTHEPKLI